MNILRLDPKLIPGWDCRNDNANCKSCNWLTENGKPRNEGIAEWRHVQCAEAGEYDDMKERVERIARLHWKAKS